MCVCVCVWGGGGGGGGGGGSGGWGEGGGGGGGGGGGLCYVLPVQKYMSYLMDSYFIQVHVLPHGSRYIGTCQVTTQLDKIYARTLIQMTVWYADIDV